MNETIRVIKGRRSIRHYKPEQISDTELQEILGCAILAPNRMNQQKWHFTVIQNEDVFNEMISIARENVPKDAPPGMAERVKSPDFSPFYHAPTVIIISGDESARLVPLDCALAAENIALAAASLNIGSCVMTSPGLIFESEKGAQLKKKIGIPDDYNHVCTVTLGYADHNPVTPLRNQDVFNYVK